MTYQIREIFYTLQGEGFHTGRPSVFCRFSGCNLWSGRESDRSNSVCRFCDTDFIGTNGENGGKYNDCNTLVEKILRVWGAETALASPFVVLTGGEPLLQVDDNLVACMHEHGCVIAVETNGTISPTAGIDWICCSPKFGAPLKLHRGNELKLVYPQIGLEPETLESLDFEHFYLQPMDGPMLERNRDAAILYCKRNPKWRLSLQTHKILGIP